MEICNGLSFKGKDLQNDPKQDGLCGECNTK